MSRATFARGLVAVLAVFIALAGVIHLVSHGHHRPEGVAEAWLSAVSDTTRKGVHDVSRRRAEKIGPVSLAAPLLALAGDTHGKRAFTSLEVGKARRGRVPFLIRYQDGPARLGVVVVQGGKVVELGPRTAGEKVPSEGGPPPSRAPLGLWVGALAVGFAIAALASVAVRLAGPEPAPAP